MDRTVRMCECASAHACAYYRHARVNAWNDEQKLPLPSPSVISTFLLGEFEAKRVQQPTHARASRAPETAVSE